MLRSRLTALSSVLLATLAVSACTKADNGAAESSQPVATVASPADTSMKPMSGMDKGSMSTTPAKDADQEFMRMMVDHHQGMIEMADTALAKNGSEHTRMDAREMLGKQTQEQKKMIDMLKSDYGDAKMPMIMPSNAQMISELTSKSGKDLDKAFKEKVIAHHEEAIKMIDDYTPKFTKPAVRTMAAKMKKDQQAEIADLKSELKKM